MRSFPQFIDGVEFSNDDITLLPLLPLCHTTTEGFFHSILLSRAVTTQDCPIYNEKLVYFFYAKPSYLVEGSDGLANYSSNPPITLIFDIDCLNKFHRLLPFDSGGFDRYNLSKGYTRDKFTHTCAKKETIQSLIKVLYENNSQYLNDQTEVDHVRKFQKLCWELKEIAKLFDNVAKGQLKTGRQVYSIEIQSKEDIKFNPKFVVLPYTFFTSDYWSETDFKNDFPDIKIHYYAKDEVLKNPNLVGYQYQDLMVKKVDEIINPKKRSDEN